MHQHLKAGDGDVDFDALFDVLDRTGFLGRKDGLIVSNVFAENENNEAVSRFQKQRIDELIAARGGGAN